MSESIRFENYELLRNANGSSFELGRGAMGVTYKARDTDLHCDVALKVISPEILGSPEVRDRFLREARAAAQLRHPNIATVFRLGVTEDGTHYYAMEFCDGQTLQQLLARLGPLPALNALHLAWQVSKALRLAEEHHIIHRDLKPSNLIVTEPPDEGFVVKVIDFGLAKRIAGTFQSLAASAPGFNGTAHYASPEQIDERDLDIRSDIYSLGACLWFMLTGRPPFEGPIARVMSQTLSAELPWAKLEGQPEPVLALLRRMLAKNRDDRPANAAALRVELEACIVAVETSEAETVAEPSEAERLAARFLLAERTGRDALGRVFHATDREQGGAAVTYRVIEPAMVAVPATRRELDQQIASGLTHPHPHLANVLASATNSQGLIVVTEQINGFTLRELLEHRGALPPKEALLLLAPLAAVADFAAARGLRGFHLTKNQTWVHFPAGTSEASRKRALREPVGTWAPHGLKVEAIFLGGHGSADDPGQKFIARSGTGYGLTQRSAPVALAHLASELLGGQGGDDFTPIADLRESANAALERACTEPGAFSTAAEFFQTLRAALDDAPSPPRGLPSPVPPIEHPRTHSLTTVAVIAALIAFLFASLGAGYHYGIRLPREREQEERAAAAALAEKNRLAAVESERLVAQEKAAAQKLAEAKPAPPALPKSGRILINTIPPRALITLDGRDTGTSPARLVEIAEGMHQLRLALDGYETAELMVEVHGGITSDPGTLTLVAKKPEVQPRPPIPPIAAAPAPPPLPPNPFTDEAVRNLIRNELIAKARGDFGSDVSCYAPVVDYFDEGKKDPAELHRSMESFRGFWPLYDVSKLSGITVHDTRDPDLKTATYTYIFLARNPRNGRQSSGLVHESVSVRNFGGSPLITRCRQSVSQRRKNF